ncbi:hypothetical protein EOI86_18740 [Hwanghaeella grinnelliae]|uniref:VPLPA-CTERM sorting domain-containing protein n=1 Tax=Hwanghaeella grinnelliae TaxID=2500179 RepID=A0A437QK37_9PROT|nr:PEP-CTERM sorting domain-containing protein [Hwanghaeella grinnelliae]RVU34876.1 hypothetical protein EOI86_18740 [Hwanghaeella grinnelliae]
MRFAGRDFLKGAVTASALMVLGSGAAQAATVFDQGFETDTAGWFDENSGWTGSVTRQASGTDGIAAHEGNFYANFQQTDTQGIGVSGAFTRFDGFRDTFPGTYSASAAIYLDTSWAAGEGFDYSVASSGSDGGHQRDFIFHVAKDTSTGSLLVGGSNNTNFDPRQDLENLNHFEVTETGWYIFEHLFREDGGQLAVDLNLYNAASVLLFTETRTNAADTIPGEVGGNRYGWFTNIDIDGGIAVDATQLNISAVPVPAALPLLLSGLGLFGIVGRFRRRAKV